MKYHRHLLRFAARFLCCAMIVLPLTAHADDTDKPEGMGFEIGNGKRMVRNMGGLYGLNVPQNWEVGFHGKFTEILTSLQEGSPRARLHINVITAEAIRTFRDLVNQLNGRGFSVAKIGSLDAVQREDELNNGRCMLDVRVFRAPQEIAVITLDGSRDCHGASAYTRIKDSLDTFKFISE
jgi:hypothetical protein